VIPWFIRKPAYFCVIPFAIAAATGTGHAQEPGSNRDCSIPKFSGTTSAAGAVAFMQVVNNGKKCGVHLTAGGNQRVQSVTVVEQPTHGTVSLTADSFGYTPTPGYAGKDQFRLVTEPPTKVQVQVNVVPTPPS
jgi:Bacterial Ig domain